ncbi:MAG: EAL domain-containing protein [Acidobacteria bacterium]|nr:EAL domain-containing protein [Acidobacteriota bacterium]
MKPTTRQSIARPFMWSIVALGALVGAYTVLHLSASQLNLSFLLLSVITIFLGSRIIVQIPRVKGKISVSDTFVLLSMLLFGSEAAVLLAGADALTSSFRVSKKKLTIAFNTAVFLCSTFLTGWVLHLFFGSVTALASQDFSARFIIAISIMGLVQYIANSGLIAMGVALKAGQPIWKMWKENFLWTSLTYFAGASASGLIAKLIGSPGIYAILATAPIIAIIYFTYRIYLKNVEAASMQADQANKHVEELNRHIAEQERISRALKESEEHFRNAFDHAVGMALVSPDGHWLQVNESLCSMLGYTQQELISSSFRSITHSDDLGNALTKIHQLLDDEISSFQIEKRYVHKLGHNIWVLLSASLVRSNEGAPRHLIFQIQDVSDRKQAEDHIRYAAFHDALTGLPNRTLLADRMSIAVERAKRLSNYKFAVLFIDLDRFKIVNDSLGHDMGDKLLIELSRRLTQCIRRVDTVARLGGDEFAILLDGITGPDVTTDITARIQESFASPFDLDGQVFFTTASIGIAFSATRYDRPEDILRDADTAMYRAKANGKARCEVFDVRMHTRAVEALKLENDLRQGIERNEIQPHYQPIISTETGVVTGLEALARWHHPQRGLVSPADFIPLAEETGLIVPLGMSVLKQACHQLRKWQGMFEAQEQLTMSVNLSGKQFAQANLVEEIRNTIRDAQLDPSCIRLEITESVVMENAISSIELLKQLKSIGVKLSIDDFGTGYSSLSYLHRFPFDILKIDRSFISRMSTDRESRSIVKTIITLATELDKDVIAEGVETEGHRAALVELSCHYGQGFLFSKPLDADKAAEFLRDRLNQQKGIPSSAQTLPNDSVATVDSSYAM